jgi:hypothetical protein
VVGQVVSRTAKLFVLGVLTQGASVVGYGATGVDLANMRIPGILQVRFQWSSLADCCLLCSGLGGDGGVAAMAAVSLILPWAVSYSGSRGLIASSR